MSYNYKNKELSSRIHGCQIPQENLTESSTYKVDGLGPSTIIEYTSECRILSEKKESDFNEAISLLKDVSLQTEVKKLQKRLKLYEPFSNNFKIEYLKNNLRFGSDFPKFIKKLRAACYQLRLGMNFSQEFRDKLKELNNNPYGIIIPEKGCDYDDILNEKYLINFNDTSNDFYDFSFRKVDINSRFLDEFSERLDKFLKNLPVFISEPDNMVMRSWISDSTSVTNEGTVKINRTIMRKFDKKDLERKESKFYRTVIHVGPANLRDAWQCDIPTLFKVKKTTFMMQQVVEHHKYSAMCSHDKSMKRRRRLTRYPYYFMTDIKKCGLSIPRVLIKTIGDILLNNEISCGEEIISIAEGSVTDKNITYYPTRGSGLGNLNEVVTLIQCIIADMLVDRGVVNSAIMFNDDASFCSNDGSIANLGKILTLYKGLGLIMNVEKSFSSKYNVFCEDYNSGEYNFSKSHLRALEICTVDNKETVWERKRVYDSICRSNSRFGKELQLLDTNEFHEFERIVPLSLGGWMDTYKGGVNLTLDYLWNHREYLSDSRDLGLVPLLNLWITFILDNQEEFKDVFFCNKKFKYRHKVKNIFNDVDLDDKYYHLGEFPDHKMTYQSYEKLYNERGLKNAKPKVTKSYGNYYSQRRFKFFNEFWQQKQYLLPFNKSSINLLRLLDLFRGDKLLNSNMAPPRNIGQGESIFIPKFKKCRYLFSKNELYSENSDLRKLRTMQSIQNGQIMTDCSLEAIDGILNERPNNSFIHGSSCRINFPVPDYYSLFCNDKTYFSSLYYSLYKKVPTSWIDLPNNLTKSKLNVYQILRPDLQEHLKEINNSKKKRIFYALSEGIALRDQKVVETLVEETLNLYKIKNSKFEQEFDCPKLEIDNAFIMSFRIEGYIDESLFSDSDNSYLSEEEGEIYRNDIYDITNDTAG